MVIEHLPCDDAVDAVVNYSGRDYPRLMIEASRIKAQIAAEQTAFERVIRQGDKALQKVMRRDGAHLSGKVAFDLATTHGLPLDILSMMVKKQGGSLDAAGFKVQMDQHRLVSRNCPHNG